ncbi:hypothetical protein DFH07DRAFT_879913 [Mycena maculata]|uniref:F-box domain-containing protein n=1 Tax=Mycena maculata TaxID=230809 RepID=A0AAD7NQI8_9AGAR|nr:hypothetical protein DFH07DRAFT_879913 [Mycena maculata]
MSLLLRLPPELIEQILVETVCAGAPNTVASVAACCRLLRELVNSIWRELFLAVFDDPRPKNALKASSPGSSSPIQPAYDWNNFTYRIAAANRFRAADPTCDFERLVDVLATAAPVTLHHTLAPVLPGRFSFPPLLSFREIPSNNISWIKQVLACGYPPLLTKRLLGSFDSEGSPFTRAEFEDTPQGKAFSKLTFLRGFILGSGSTEHARAIARTRVYNTRYLMAERCWGPFQPLDPAHPLLDPDDDIDDPDYDPGASDSDSDDAPGDTPHILHFLSSHGIDFADDRTHPTYVFPAPHRVVPDYAFLSAARFIMETNMREKFEMELLFNSAAASVSQIAAADVGLELNEVVDAMQSPDLLRMGGAPGFWDVWRPQQPEVDEDEEPAPPPVDKGKGKASEAEVEGWDWAGVEGEWRRVVCWLDYRDLLMHNVDIASAGFGLDDLQEEIRIFPMTLRITQYSPPPRPPPGADPNQLLYRLPVIHVAGESRGTDTDEGSGRAIEGTVRMIGDGAVRWSMTSSEAAGADPEWVTESVQVGDIGSAVGIIGLWTGAEHSSTDPLGPCWAWKIASRGED